MKKIVKCCSCFKEIEEEPVVLGWASGEVISCPLCGELAYSGKIIEKIETKCILLNEEEVKTLASKFRWESEGFIKEALETTGVFTFAAKSNAETIKEANAEFFRANHCTNETAKAAIRKLIFLSKEENELTNAYDKLCRNNNLVKSEKILAIKQMAKMCFTI